MNTEIIKINNLEIVCPIENGEQYVAVKPICELLGIDDFAQRQRIKRDEILSSVECIIQSTGADLKKYDMTCLPVRYIFGWLFSIDTDKVKPEAKEQVIKYKQICNDALFDHFMGPVAQRRKQLSRKISIDLRVEEIEEELKTNALYNELQQLKIEKRKIGSDLKEIDFQMIGTQLQIFMND